MEENGLHIRYAELADKKDELEAELKDLKMQMADLEKVLIEKFINEEIQRMSIKGGKTLRLDRKIWPKVSSAEDAVTAIEAAGLNQLLARRTYQAMSLAAYLRECDKHEIPLPEEFKGVIEPNEVFKIIVTKY